MPAIPTFPLHIIAKRADDSVVAGAKVRLTLVRVGATGDHQVVVPHHYAGVCDDQGLLTLNPWAHEDGTTQYRVQITGDNIHVDGLATMPPEESYLADILHKVTPPVDDATVMVARARAWAAQLDVPVQEGEYSAKHHALRAAEKAQQTFDDRQATAEDRQVAAAMRAGAEAAEAAAAVAVGQAQFADYDGLRAYIGTSKVAYVTGLLVTAKPSGIAGFFTRDETDTTSADNGGTIIVSADGTRWKRVFDGAVNVMWHGAKGDGVTDDRAAIQAAIDAHESIYFPARRFYIQAVAAGHVYGNSTVPVWRGLNINKSNLSISAELGATLLLNGAPSPSTISFVMSTDKNMALGAVSNIRISGLDFDFNPTGRNAGTYRSIQAIGVRGLILSDLYLYSSGSRFGATITVQNSDQVRVSGVRMRNVTQGMNFSYVDDVEFENIMLDNFSEGIDFDRMVSRCKANNVTFTLTFGGLNGQCWDLNSVRDSTFRNITANRSGNVMYVNFKQTTPPTYADYVSNAPINIYTPSRNITIDGVNIHSCAQNAVALYIGDDHDTQPDVLTRDITLRNVHMVQSGGIEVRMAVGVMIDGLTMIDATPQVTAGCAALVALAGARANAKCGVHLSNITINGVVTNQKAIRLSGCEEGMMDRLHIENYPLDAVEISAAPSKAIYSLTNSRFRRSIDTVVTGTALRLASWVFGDVSFSWGNNQITQFTNPIVITDVAAANAMPKTRIAVGQFVVPAATTKRVLCWADPTLSAYVAMVKPVSGLAIAADGSNFVAYNLRRDGVSVCSGSDTAGAAAGVPVNIGYQPPEALANVDPGQAMYLEAAGQGTGRTLDAFEVQVHALPYIKV